MTLKTVKTVKNDLAKYPFLRETAEYVKKLDFKIGDLVKPEFTRVIARAKERVEEALLYGLVSRKLHKEQVEIEILSFPLAIILVLATKSTFTKKRYALAEAKQVHSSLTLESPEKIMLIAQNFGWKIQKNHDVEIPYEFYLHFSDYLRNTTHLLGKKWKLVNHLLLHGQIYLTKRETTRLLREETRKYYEKRLDIKELPNFPSKILEVAQKINNLSIRKIGKTEIKAFPKVIEQRAFPPCVSTLYASVLAGRHISHIGRFTLTTFLVNIGMPPENILELFKNFSDFNERLTRYQIEHIAGQKGSRTQYVPPKCETLKTHSVCIHPDEVCLRIRHPLTYYRKKIASKIFNPD